jgi:NOL1/NOP2/fmu family ribosome biogenesis protein
LASTAPKARHLARATRGGHFKAPQAAGGSAGRTPRLAFEVPHAARDLYLDFCAQHLKHAPGESRLAVAGSYLYAVPDGLPDMGNLRAVHPGWWLGSFKKDRFEPSHALALGLGPADARLPLDLEPDQPDVLAYLRGEALHSQGEDGWVLVSAGGYSLGWGKRVRGMLKSHYPRGLRRY